MCLCEHAQGGVKKAVLGTLTFMVGGDQASFEAAKPYLEVMGLNIVHCGPSGSGQVAKICNNMAMAINMAGCAEAMNLAISQGIDPHIFTGIINSSSGGSWISSVYGCVPDTVEGSPSNNGKRTQPAPPGSAQDFLTLRGCSDALAGATARGICRAFEHCAALLHCCTGYRGGFSNRLLLKDVKLARGAAQAVGEHTPMASMAESLWERLCAGGHADLDQGSIYEHVYRAKAVAPPPDA